MTQATTTIGSVNSSLYSSPSEDADYKGLCRALKLAFHGSDGPLFTTDTEGLYDAFLEALPADRRAHYECRSCRSFVERFGGLVQIDAAGVAESAFWGTQFAPNFFDASIHALRRLVARAKVTGVFLSELPVLGVPANESPKAEGGWWHHMHTTLPSAMLHKHATLTPFQRMAERKEEYGMLCHGLADFPIEIVRQAHTLLTTGQLFRSEKCIGVAKWLLDLHQMREATKNRVARVNLTWLAVASAPPGFCHVRSSMIGTLLEDIAAGKNFADIKRAFDAKMNPTQYQRPQAAPTDGQLAAAETLVGKLASAGSLARRYARLEEVLPHAIWQPRAAQEGKPTAPRAFGDVFGHLRTKPPAPRPIDVPAQTMTWAKFQREVLPTAERLEYQTKFSVAAFFAFVTAANPDAPPILQWDREDARNPVNHYLYTNGSNPEDWGLASGRWIDVNAVTLQASSWANSVTRYGDGVYLLLQGCRDQRQRAGLALFPENMRAEYYGVRAAIEAFSRAGTLQGAEQATACGVALQKGASSTWWNQTIRVTSRGSVMTYKLDRWD